MPAAGQECPMTDSHEKPLILVVDDESHILHVVSLKLRNAGYDVLTAADGQEGYELAIQRRPHLVITDYQMPIMTGLELCRKLRKHGPTVQTPVLMITARGAGLSDDDLVSTSIQGVLTKPFSPRQVLVEVQALVPADGKVSV
jgi:CheY-like chemotaxis protein